MAKLVSDKLRACFVGRAVRAAGRELNPGHADFQSAALPTELPGLIERRIKQARALIVNEDSHNQAFTWQISA